MRRVGFAEWLTIGALALAAVVWLVRLEGRVNAQDVKVEQQEQNHKDTIAQFRADLAYIRMRIDDALTTKVAP